jgi:hypothetical protein
MNLGSLKDPGSDVGGASKMMVILYLAILVALGVLVFWELRRMRRQGRP